MKLQERIDGRCASILKEIGAFRKFQDNFDRIIREREAKARAETKLKQSEALREFTQKHNNKA